MSTPTPRSRAGPRGALQALLLYARLHPWLTLEHTVLAGVLLVCAANGGGLLWGVDWAQHCAAGEQECCCPSRRPGSPRVFEAADLAAAPPASMAMDAVAAGQVVEHHDFRGDIYKLALGDGMMLNAMKTKKGSLRSGDLHNCTQYDVILRGRAKLHTLDIDRGVEVIKEYGPNDFIVIPPRLAHLFEFLEDNFMVEWWDCDFQAWYYKPFRDQIAREFARQQLRPREQAQVNVRRRRGRALAAARHRSS